MLFSENLVHEDPEVMYIVIINRDKDDTGLP